jgi:hypothetical protein
MEGIEVESNPHQRVKWQLAMVTVSAIVVIGALAAALGQERTGTLMEAGSTGMSRGQTSTEMVATTTVAPETSKASPTMKAARPNGFG